MQNPLVSIFIPYYNDEAFIADAIKSCLSQTYQNWELFLFNHASTDGSRDIARSFDDPRIRHVDAAENLGAGSGYNLKITLPRMSGKYVKLFCADDVMKEDCLEKFVQYLENNPLTDIVFSDVEYFSKDKKLLFRVVNGVSLDRCGIGLSELDLLKCFLYFHSYLPYSSSLIKRDKICDAYIDTTSVMLFDITLWCSLLINGCKIGYINAKTVLYRVSENQMMSEK